MIIIWIIVDNIHPYTKQIYGNIILLWYLFLKEGLQQFIYLFIYLHVEEKLSRLLIPNSQSIQI